jgi:lipopolysaccharide/colanic/teichoic acid biosynthesis glycosyltransferase
MEPVIDGNRHGVSVAAALPAFDDTPSTLTHQISLSQQETAGAWRWDSERTRRLLNVIAAVALLILTLPLMLSIALLVRITSRGPSFYRQLRVGLDRRRDSQLNGNWRRKVDHGGRLFNIYKFRTMYVGADESGEVWASHNDPRVTPIGHFLRKYRLDELPQVFNVLKGDMNLVGPRPEQPRIFAELRQQIDRYPSRQQVLPGITGWAQVNQHYDSCLEDVRSKLLYDLEYLRRCSAAEDLKILMRTVPVVLLKKGAW